MAESGEEGRRLRLSRSRMVSRSYFCLTYAEDFCTESLIDSVRTRASGNEVSHCCHTCSILYNRWRSVESSLQESKKNKQIPKNNNLLFPIIYIKITPSPMDLDAKIYVFYKLNKQIYSQLLPNMLINT